MPRPLGVAGVVTARVEGGTPSPQEDVDADGNTTTPLPRYLLPPIQTLLLTPTPPTPTPPPVPVLHTALLGRALPPTGATITLELPSNCCWRYACQARRLAPYDDEDNHDPILRERMRRVRAWGGGLVTQATRVVVQGQTCVVVDPTLEAWAAVGVAVGEGKEEEDVIYGGGGLLPQLCLRLHLGTTRRISGDGSNAAAVVIIEGAPGLGKTSLAGAAARRSGLPTVLVRPGDLIARHDVEADAALEEAAAAARALAPAVLLLDNADLLCGGGPERAGRLLAASRAEGDRAVGRWVTRAVEEGGAVLGPGVALVLTVREGWRLHGDGDGEQGGVTRLRMAAATVGPAAASAVLRSELKGSPLLCEEAEVVEEAARCCQGFTLGEVAAVARRARSLIASSSNSWPQALDVALAEARTRRLASGAGLPPLGKVDPPVTWDDVGGLRTAKAAVREMVTWPMAHARAFARLGIAPPTGLLLYGPPGTGKTLIAQAAACQTGAAFLALRISDIVRGEIGTAEIALRDAFRAAIRSRPALIFIDEFQALFTARDSGGGSGGRLASQLLQSMDELRGAGGAGGDGEQQGYVSVLAATNAPEAIDPAFLRPGRFDSLVYAPLPDLEDRLEILQGLQRRMPCWGPDVDPRALAQRTEGYSGADLANLLRRAALHALASAPPSDDSVPPALLTPAHVEAALSGTRPSTTGAQVERYRAFARRHGGGRA